MEWKMREGGAWMDQRAEGERICRCTKWLRKEEKERNRKKKKESSFRKKKKKELLAIAEQKQSKDPIPHLWSQIAKIEGTLTSLFPLKCTIVLVRC